MTHLELEAQTPELFAGLAERGGALLEFSTHP